MLINPSPLVEKILGLAIDVHKTVGPGLLESAYDSCLTYEFVTAGLAFKKQVPIPVVYKGVTSSAATAPTWSSRARPRS